MAKFGGLNRLAGFLLAGILSVMCSGCIPSFIPLSDPKSVPAGPKVSDLIDNLKCELAETRFPDPKKEGAIPYGSGGEKNFLLSNQLSYIHYVATATFTLTVTNTQNFAPSVSFINNLPTPMSNLTLTVGAQFMESEDRNITLNMTVDLDNLKSANFKHPCGKGTELQGDLALREIIAMGLIASAENDVGVIPSKPANGAASVSSIFGAPNASVKSSDPKSTQYTTMATNYSLGSFGTITDFMITEGASGGPGWTLSHFKGPSGSWLGLTRVVKDQLNISFIPYCSVKNFKGQIFYPTWLPGIPASCDKTPGTDSAAAVGQALDMAIGAGISNNTTQLLQSIQPAIQ